MSTITFTSTPFDIFEVDGCEYSICLFQTNHWAYVSLEAYLLYDPTLNKQINYGTFNPREKQTITLDLSESEGYQKKGNQYLRAHWSRIPELRKCIPSGNVELAVSSNRYKAIKDAFAGILKEASKILHETFAKDSDFNSLNAVESLFNRNPLKICANVYKRFRLSEKMENIFDLSLFETLSECDFCYNAEVRIQYQLPEALKDKFDLKPIRVRSISTLTVSDGVLIAKHSVRLSQTKVINPENISKSEYAHYLMEYVTVAGEDSDPISILNRTDKSYTLKEVGLS